MDAKLEYGAFLTPRACFTIACITFSFVAISTIWRNSRTTSVSSGRTERTENAVPDRSRAQRRIAVNDLNADRGDVPMVVGMQKCSAAEERQRRIDDLGSLCSRVAQRLRDFQDVVALRALVVNLLGELSLLTTSLCRLQQVHLSNAHLLRNSAGIIACFDAAIGSLSATLLDLEGFHSSASHSHDLLVDGIQQVKNQQQVICFLLSNLTANIPPTPPSGDDIPSSSQGPEPCSSSDAGSDSEISTDVTPGVDDNCWMEPPPEYSPPQQNISTRFIEKACSTTEPHGILARSPEQKASGEDENRLLDAVLQNDSRALSSLLDNFADPSVHIGELQRTPLHQAAHLNHCSCITILLKHGAVMNTEDVKGDTALHLAAWAGHVEALAALLAHGADVDWLSGRDGYSPLWCAISSYQIDAARLLLRHGARVSLRAASGGGLMPLHQAAVTGQSAMCELLLERGAQPDCLDDEKNTPLHHAAACGSAASVRVLLRGGAKIESRQVQGLTALHWAAHKGHAEVISVLLDSGAAINCQANESGGVTPLHLAANRGHAAAARMLLDRGADGNVVAVSWDGVTGTPVELAKARGHSRLLKMLKR